MRRRTILAGGGIVGLLGLSLALFVGGCGDTESGGYDPAMRFPPRTDRLVVSLPSVPPLRLHDNGRLDDTIRELDALGGRTLDPTTLPASERRELDDSLLSLFGTPAAPKVDDGESLGLISERLALGSRLYKDKCVQCHGTNGNGRGPTGMWVYPHPRDFRLGKAKYVSTPGGVGRPSRADLLRVLRVGIAGNAMPPYGLLPEGDLEALVSYTIFLSLRGQVEFDVLTAVMSDDGLDGTIGELAAKRAKHWLADWIAANRSGTVVPEVPADSTQEDRVRRGHSAFQVAGCAACHRDYGRETHYLYDVWGVAVRPSNLTLGEWRGGGDPTELFKRVRCGIAPSGMPAAGSLSDADTWDVVAFLRALSVPRQLPAELRAKIYPDAK